ncbi:protein DBF4 homolog B [Sphaeramia orbicularis]|uniref:protein DBF4 homolog B n=1 Tax=Sphaeramia orbicularis TaxID=375764 RepID=UPI00117CF3D1|nr:protein DBF4 homolog B-like [Sphaeramia orbicularis]
MQQQQQKYPEKCGLLGKLCSGQKKLEGKIFYLDQVKKRCTALLLEAICLLGGKVESFLHKDVNFVVTGNQEGLTEQRSLDSKAGTKVMSEEPQRPVRQRESIFSNDKQRPSTSRPMACGSRGKALLEKAIRNNERLQGSSVLANARSWGVKILHADDVLLYLKRLTRESISAKQKSEKVHPKQGSHVVKATALRSPYLKIEDSSRKYKPLHMQSMTFPTMYYLGRFSPFECPPPPRFDKWAEPEKKKNREMSKVENSIEDKSKSPLSPLSCNPSPWKPRKKDLSYCECCQQAYTNQDEHLQSSQHRTFALDSSNYGMVDQLIAAMIPGFDPNPSDQLEEPLNRPPTPVPLQDVCELEPLTDVETEHAVQALRMQHSPFSAHISSPTRGPASPFQGVQCLITNEADVDMQLLTPETDCQVPEGQVHNLSPTMPMLDPEPVCHHSICQQPDKPPSSCPDIHCLSSDNCFLPPVLSPQVPNPYHMEPHSPYSEPPVLSPQQYPAEEPMEEDFCKMDFPADTLLISAPVFHFKSLVKAEGEVEMDQKKLLGLSRTVCLNSIMECNRLGSHRSRSLPRPSTKPSNPKKRCRSASPACRLSKRRRKTSVGGYSNKWLEKSESELTTMIEDFSLFDKKSSQMIQSSPIPVSPSICTVQRLGLKQQTSSTVSVTCVKDQTTWPLHSQASLLATPLQFPSDKCQSVFSSQDSQHSLSHSTSICIEPALIPDFATLDPSSSDSDWDSDLLSRLGPASVTPASPTEQICELDKELLHRPCTWMHDTSYESRLHTVLQPSTQTVSLCGDEVDPTVFSRTVVQIVEVQH